MGQEPCVCSVAQRGSMLGTTFSKPLNMVITLLRSFLACSKCLNVTQCFCRLLLLPHAVDIAAAAIAAAVCRHAWSPR